MPHQGRDKVLQLYARPVPQPSQQTQWTGLRVVRGALRHEKDHEDGVDDIQVVLTFLASSAIVYLREHNRTLSCRDSGD